MSGRLFSIVRRKAGVVHFVTPLVSGQDQYRLKWAANFDGSFATFLTTTNTGYVDPTIDRAQQTVLAGNNVQMLINPTTFTIPDAKPFWLQYVPVTGGVEGTPSGLLLVLPPTAGNPIVAVAGSAPSGANQAASLRLDFPKLVTDLRIQNLDGSNSLMVAFDEGGPEITLKAPDADPQFMNIQGAHPSIWVRGSGGAVAFTATFTFAFAK